LRVNGTHDVACVTTNGTASVMHKFTGVFNGTLAEVTTGGWPAVVHAGTFVFSGTGNTTAPVVVDSSRQKIYAFAGGGTGTNAVAAQADTSLTAASKVVVNVGSASTNAVLEGDFNNAYYSGGASTASFLWSRGLTDCWMYTFPGQNKRCSNECKCSGSGRIRRNGYDHHR
jgi:hypothetical protein